MASRDGYSWIIGNESTSYCRHRGSGQHSHSSGRPLWPGGRTECRGHTEGRPDARYGRWCSRLACKSRNFSAVAREADSGGQRGTTTSQSRAVIEDIKSFSGSVWSNECRGPLGQGYHTNVYDDQRPVIKVNQTLSQAMKLGSFSRKYFEDICGCSQSYTSKTRNAGWSEERMRNHLLECLTG